MGPRAGLDRCGKSRHHRDSIPGPSSQKTVATLTELLGPQATVASLQITDNLKAPITVTLDITTQCVSLQTVYTKHPTQINKDRTEKYSNLYKFPKNRPRMSRREQMYSSTLSVTSALDGVSGQGHAAAALPPGKTLYPSLFGHRFRLKDCGKSRPPPLTGFDPRNVQPVGSRYTD